MKVAVCIPAYNEEDNIVAVIKSIPREIPNVDKVIVVVVDDGSQDSTFQVAKSAGADYVYKHSVNSGVVFAFGNGIRKAVENGADIIVNIDGDGQFDSAEIPYLIEPIIEGSADVVLGSRFIHSGKSNIPVPKRIGNLIISLIVSLLSGKRIYDTQCGFRALSRPAAKQIQLSGLFTYTQEMILNLSFHRMRFVEHPITVKYFGNRKSRVVKSISKYTFKVLGVLLVATLRRFGAIVFLLMLGVLSSIVLLYLI